MSSARRVLLVDGANVVGSVPDGWWRDRPGAAARLHAGLVAAHGGAGVTGNVEESGAGKSGYDETVLVLEGQARAGVPAGRDRGVQTVHARGSGDDEIVRQCQLLVADGAAVTVATADRGLIARLPSAGVAIVGPRTIRAPAGRPGR